MNEKPWRPPLPGGDTDPLTGKADDLSASDLLELELDRESERPEAERRPAEEIRNAAIRRFCERYPVASRRMTGPELELEALSALVSDHVGEGKLGKRATPSNLMAADRFRKRLRGHLVKGGVSPELVIERVQSGIVATDSQVDPVSELIERVRDGKASQEERGQFNAAYDAAMEDEVAAEIETEADTDGSARDRVRHRITKSEEYFSASIGRLRKTPLL